MGDTVSVIVCFLVGGCAPPAPTSFPTAPTYSPSTQPTTGPPAPTISPSTTPPVPTLTPGNTNGPTEPVPSAGPTTAAVPSPPFRLTFGGLDEPNPDLDSRLALPGTLSDVLSNLVTGIASIVDPFEDFQESFSQCRVQQVSGNGDPFRISYVATFVFTGQPIATPAEAEKMVRTLFLVADIDNLFVGFNEQVLDAIQADTDSDYRTTTTLGFEFV